MDQKKCTIMEPPHRERTAWPQPEWSSLSNGESIIHTVAVISSSPNARGLTAMCAKAAAEGVENGGGAALRIDLNQLTLAACIACGNGFGTCRDEGRCQVEDDFQLTQRKLCACDAAIIVTPVYWGEMSESAKCFFDRLRRCEAYKSELSCLHKKPIIAVAAAGGSGNGTLSCLSQMERYIQHLGGICFDTIAVMQRNRSYKMRAISSAAQALLQMLADAQ